MKQVEINDNFEEWRNAARNLVIAGVHPDDILWSPVGAGLFSEREPRERQNEGLAPSQQIFLPKAFMELAKVVACYDDPGRWALLYRIVYRILNESRDLLEIVSDKDVCQLMRMKKSISRDVHKFHAFVRFRQIESDGSEIFVAWHEPHHFTVELSAPFFVRRFGSMKFSILTPKGCAHWNLDELTFSEPVARNRAPSRDDTEEYWLTYYKSIYNPFRLKVNAMKAEMPMRHWRTLPETALIRELIRKGK